jgi:hypothetical protein
VISVWTVLWLVWGAIFLAIELPAMWSRIRGGTLSEHVWTFLEVGVPKEKQSPRAKWKRILFIGFWGWLTLHFFAMWA